MNTANSNSIQIEGITLNPDIIQTLKQWQERDNLQCDVITIDDAINHIIQNTPEGDEEASALLFRLSRLRGYLKKLNNNT